MPKPTQALTKRQKALVNAYTDPKVTTQRQAALIAGYSQRSIDAVASEALSNPKVKAAIERKLAKQTDKYAQLERILRRTLTRLEQVVNHDQVDPVLVGNIAQLAGQLQKQEWQRQQERGEQLTTDSAALETWKSRVRHYSHLALRCSRRFPYLVDVLPDLIAARAERKLSQV